MWLYYLLDKNSSVAITFNFQLDFSNKAEIKYKNSWGICDDQGILAIFLCSFFLITDVNLDLKMLKLDMQPNFGLVKNESGFIVRSVETVWGRWMLVVAVISVDAYSFFGFLRPDMSPWGYGNRCFLDALCCLIVRRPNLEVATRRLLCQQVKILE